MNLMNVEAVASPSPIIDVGQFIQQWKLLIKIPYSTKAGMPMVQAAALEAWMAEISKVELP
ncbi:hypothetical protein CCR75_001229 [Bremia lactucae]|uniref:Uncharacterized protein n=1 Tax=Bremia lactucae TaxID=4779 RepID=A0A976IFW3_BRELC|nr:hypothetical protein CCR75_001229 [Bremia lactucae]